MRAGCFLVSVLSLAWWKRAGGSLTARLLIICTVFCVRAGLVAGESPTGPLLWTVRHGTCGLQTDVGANPGPTGNVGEEEEVRAGNAQDSSSVSIDRV